MASPAPASPAGSLRRRDDASRRAARSTTSASSTVSRGVAAGPTAGAPTIGSAASAVGRPCSPAPAISAAASDGSAGPSTGAGVGACGRACSAAACAAASSAAAALRMRSRRLSNSGSTGSRRAFGKSGMAISTWARAGGVWSGGSAVRSASLSRASEAATGSSRLSGCSQSCAGRRAPPIKSVGSRPEMSSLGATWWVSCRGTTKPASAATPDSGSASARGGSKPASAAAMAEIAARVPPTLASGATSSSWSSSASDSSTDTMSMTSSTPCSTREAMVRAASKRDRPPSAAKSRTDRTPSTLHSSAQVSGSSDRLSGAAPADRAGIASRPPTTGSRSAHTRLRRATSARRSSTVCGCTRPRRHRSLRRKRQRPTVQRDNSATASWSSSRPATTTTLSST